MDAQKLAEAVLEMKTKVRTIMDADVPEIEAVRDDLRDVKDLLGVLANIIGGKSVERAFGSPGDWGYNTPIGAALAIRDTAHRSGRNAGYSSHHQTKKEKEHVRTRTNENNCNRSIKSRRKLLCSTGTRYPRSGKGNE